MNTFRFYRDLFIGLALIAAGFAWLLFQPLMESRTYNKLTGANTTWWDAFWVELRVTDQLARP